MAEIQIRRPNLHELPDPYNVIHVVAPHKRNKWWKNKWRKLELSARNPDDIPPYFRERPVLKLVPL